jgi:hypothetical protein
VRRNAGGRECGWPGFEQSWEGDMANAKWTIKGREFVHCNCAYGCPCQFNARPTHGSCLAVLAV